MEIILAVIMGALFGLALYLVGASDSKKLLSMLRLENLTLMKIIVFAIGFSSVLVSGANALGVFDVSHLSIKTANLGVIVGGLIFGLGFGWAGTCPGTCVAASSSGAVKKALTAAVGGLTGALVFSLTYGFWEELGLFSVLDMEKLTLFSVSEEFPSVFALGYTGLFITGILFMTAAYFLPSRGIQGNKKQKS